MGVLCGGEDYDWDGRRDKRISRYCSSPHPTNSSTLTPCAPLRGTWRIHSEPGRPTTTAVFWSGELLATERLGIRVQSSAFAITVQGRQCTSHTSTPNRCHYPLPQAILLHLQIRCHDSKKDVISLRWSTIYVDGGEGLMVMVEIQGEEEDY